MRVISTVVSIATLIAGNTAFAAVAELHVGEKLARADLLKAGVHRYVRYSVTPDGHRKVVDIWSREIRFDAQNGRKLLHIHQQWDEISPSAVLIQDSLFEPDTLRPLTHVKNLTREGKNTVGGYRFLPDKIVGMDDLPNNSRKDFVQVSKEPAYNWETDMEMLQALPLAQGYAANINFYDPPLDPPARYEYSVTGSEKIRGPDDRGIDCWVVSIEFKADKATRRFWFDKKTQVLVREETELADGSKNVKMLLSPEESDARF